jgi:hypothetical protein
VDLPASQYAAGWVSSRGCNLSASPHQRDARAPETAVWRKDVADVDEEDAAALTVEGQVLVQLQ